MPAIGVLKSFPGHKGIPGHQGGSLPKGYINVKFYDPSYPLEPFGYRVSTIEERAQFIKAINTLPFEIKQLWKSDRPLILVIKPDEKIFGKHQGNWIMLGTESVDDFIAPHEFVHHIIGQYLDKLGAYKPSTQFLSAHHYNDPMQNKNEDLTAMLMEYDADPGVWASKLPRVDSLIWDGDTGTRMTPNMAKQKVSDARNFLDWLKRHSND